jgi:serine/threonine-protein kinase
MGEVFRAHDLILNQAVALKFLGSAHFNEAALARFRNEVRLARQVSHPNVCRVYDIGVLDGTYYLSMEYLDGEDLASLLRRIGRLPQDKAVEFTRKICAGLAAAHERGVLHRDLKPANIMIDGRGEVRITDFGLAALAQEVAPGDIRSGTPAYMAPEQRSGREVTARSDIYSLGLTVYEMITGKRRDATAADPSRLVKELDPAVERVILRCLEEDPKRRPASALHVAMALPGGDPIAAALAAGETPSPEMVAASEEKQSFRPRAAVLWLALAFACAPVFAMYFDRMNLTGHIPLEIPPEALAFRAGEVLKQLGYSGTPRHAGYGFEYVDRGYARLLGKTVPDRLDDVLASHRPAVIGFWYRQHGDYFRVDSFLPADLLVTGNNDVLRYDSPPNTEAGMIRLRLDPRGRLIALEVRPRPSPAERLATPEWTKLLAAAELDPARFAPAPPRDVPPVPFDARAAWDGTFGPERSEKVHVEAAAWQGKPVYFSVGGDWQGNEPADASPYGPWFTTALAVFYPCYFLGAAVLAWRNLYLGRSDRRGALQLAGAVFVAALLAWGFGAAHVPTLWEFRLLAKALAWALLLAVAFGALYLGVEPHVRRHWPDSLISWSRLQAGRFRDPLVCSHVLAGIGAGLAAEAVFGLQGAVAGRYCQDVLPIPLDALTSVPAFWGMLFTVVGAFFSYILLVAPLVRLFFRRPLWLADSLAAVLAAGPQFAMFDNMAQNLMFGSLSVLWNGMVLWLLRRFGFLAAVAAVLTNAMYEYVMPIQPWSWFGGRSLVILAIPVLIAAWTAWTLAPGSRRPGMQAAS